MFTRIINGVLRRLFPAWQKRRDLKREMVSRAREFRSRVDAMTDMEAIIAIHIADPLTKLEQQPKEILALVSIVERLKPLRILEIGGRRGGSFSLFTRISSPEAKLLSIDLAYPPERVAALKCFQRLRQTIDAFSADSHASETLHKVENWLQGEQLDFLFIDGDHTYDGVKSDFQMFAPLVRKGGVIALHDIVEDYFTRYGRKTPCDTGGVPIYWRELKALGYVTEEYIQDAEQDGYGIGVVTWPGTPR